MHYTSCATPLVCALHNACVGLYNNYVPYTATCAYSPCRTELSATNFQVILKCTAAIAGVYNYGSGYWSGSQLSEII